MKQVSKYKRESEDFKSKYLDALRQARDIQIDYEAKLRSVTSFESELSNLRRVHQSTHQQLESISGRYQEQIATTAFIKKQMNEVYVKLMAGKRGFKIPSEVEEILLKNLQDSMREGNGAANIVPYPVTSKDGKLAKDSFFLTDGGISIEEQKQEAVKPIKQESAIEEDYNFDNYDESESIKNSKTGGSMARKMDDIDKLLDEGNKAMPKK